MILGNEAKVIARCLRAVRPYISSYSISCNGTDETRDVIRRELEGIPGVIHERPWVNFGHNRTESFELAAAWLRERDGEEALATTWCLLLDADHELTVPVAFPELVEGAYLVWQKDASLTYPNVRLVRADQPARCCGVTHEFWRVERPSTPIDGLLILDHGDGGSRSDKLERDERLLRAGLEDEADKELHGRYRFYLAQTLQDAGRFEEAAEWYRERAELKGDFEEERWMARLRRGRCLIWAKREPEGEAELARAWQERPQRAEPLYWLAKHHREAGRNHLAEIYATRAAAIPYPAKDILFVEHGVYTHGCEEEVSITGWYTGAKERSREACEKLMATPGVNVGRTNICWYGTTVLGETGNFDVPEELRTFEGIVYNCSNPSICGDVELVRLVNYTQERGRWYVGHPEPGIIQTRNAIRRVGGDWKLLDDGPVTSSAWNHDVAIHGLEDIRIAEWKGRHWFTATTSHVPGARGPQVVLGRLSEDLERVEHLVPIKYDKRQDVEKNWILWPLGEELFCIYSFDPFVVLKLEENGDATEFTRSKTRWYQGRFRGSSSVISIPGAPAFAVAHDVSNLVDRNVYTHRFIHFDGNGIQRFSKPLLFERHAIEYVAGATVRGDDLVLSYGVEDRKAHWRKIPLPTVNELLAT
jgi:tetratricopeptide (TPR) repeat protein